MFKFFKNDVSMALSLLRIQWSSTFIGIGILGISLYEGSKIRSFFSISYDKSYYTNDQYFHIDILWFIRLYKNCLSKINIRIY